MVVHASRDAGAWPPTGRKAEANTSAFTRYQGILELGA